MSLADESIGEVSAAAEFCWKLVGGPVNGAIRLGGSATWFLSAPKDPSWRFGGRHEVGFGGSGKSEAWISQILPMRVSEGSAGRESD
jgi:hypothetical protein